MARRFQLRLAFRFALFCFNYIFANFAFGRKGPPVNYSKSLFLLIFWQCSPSIVNVNCSLSRQFCLAIVGTGYASFESVAGRVEYPCQNLLAAVKWKPRDKRNSADSRCAPQQKNHPNRKRKLLHEALQHANRRATNTISAGEWFEKLVAVQKRLRAPQGCPWDREQTHATLRPYLIEEAYEVIDALDSGDDAKFAEEMGDLLLQVVFHSEIAREQERFSVADVVREIHDKMVRRHPHVFGKVRARNSAEVLQNWERIKAAERLDKDNSSENGASKSQQKPTSLLDGVSAGLPAMLQGAATDAQSGPGRFRLERCRRYLRKIARRNGRGSSCAGRKRFQKS